MIILKTHDAPMLRANGNRWAGNGNELSTGFQDSQRFLERHLVQALQDNVVVTKDVCEVFLLVVDHDVGPETPHRIHVVRARGRRHRRTDVFRELNGECAHTTRTRVDAGFLSSFQIRSFD